MRQYLCHLKTTYIGGLFVVVVVVVVVVFFGLKLLIVDRARIIY